MKPAARKPPEDTVEVFDEEEYPQGSDEWKGLRLGLPTASRFGAIMADSEEKVGRTKLMQLLAGEILTGAPMETFSNAAMKHGVEVEPEALEHYAFVRGVEVARVGFIKRTIPLLAGSLVVGCSPDGLVGADGIVQCKRMQPDLLVALVDGGKVPMGHRPQLQGEMWVAGRRWADLKFYYPGMPVSPTFRFERDEAYIGQLRNEVERFAWDLRKLVARVRQKGGIR
jgi:hypothetical protein